MGAWGVPLWWAAESFRWPHEPSFGIVAEMTTSTLVTGAGRGIGAAIAQALAEAGHRVAVHAGHDAEAAERVRAGVLAALEELGDAPELYAVTPEGRPQRVAMSTYVQAWTIGARDALRAGWDGRSGS